MNEPRFEFRALEKADLPILREWLGRPHLLEWWGPERTLGEVRETYLPRIAGDDGRARVHPSTSRLGGATLSDRGIPPRSTPHTPAEAPPHG